VACGSGEVTESLLEWWSLGQSRSTEDGGELSGRSHIPTPPSLSPSLPKPQVLAADPFTSAAYHDRTGLPCAALSFRDISDGALSEPNAFLTSGLHTGDFLAYSESMVICSFALHLVESPSALFSLLWELSTKFRWLVVLAPHKKPEIRSGWGWVKWNVDTWQQYQVQESKGEFLKDRVHCRIYRSTSL